MADQWTIWRFGEKVPVVPCDDEAIRRAHLALAARTEIPMRMIDEVTEIVLRAAGEVPDAA